MASRLFRIQYVSDLHLERYSRVKNSSFAKPVAPYLALAGDIGYPSTPTWNSFLHYANKNWDHVFYVAGTKEYDRSISFNKQHMEMKDNLRQFKNITLLDTFNPSFYFPKENVAMVGSTLWSFVKNENYTNALHCLDKAILEKHIEFWTYQKANIVMLTHHMPSHKLISPRFETKDNDAYTSNCEYLMNKQVRAWIYGRTHNVSSRTIKNTLAVVNARGYPMEQVPGFTNQTFIELDVGPDEEGANIDLAMAAMA